MRAHNLTGVLPDLPFFYLRGAFDVQSMKAGDRFLIGLLRKSIAKKDPSQYETWEKALVEAGDSPADWTARENLSPILEYAAGL